MLVSCFMDSSGIGMSCYCWEVRLVESCDLHLDKMVQGPRWGGVVIVAAPVVPGLK